MASTIKLKNGSGAPLASDLVQGEPALDLTNKRLYTEDSGGNVIEVGTNPTEITTGDITATGTTTITTADINGGTIDGVTLGTNSAVTSAVITTADINGGTIDGTTIGGASAGAGTFTTGQFDTSLNVDGTVTVTNAEPEIRLSDTSDLNSEGHIRYNAGVLTLKADPNDAVLSSSMRFDVDGSEAMRIDSSGAVLVNNLSALESEKLRVTGTNGSLALDPGDFFSHSVAIFENDSECTVTIASDSASSGLLRFTDVDGNSGEIEYDHASDYMAFTTNASEAMRIDSSGNVGIGTSSPTKPLDVVGDIVASSDVFYGNRLLALDAGADGTAAAPSISVGYDYDTGFFRPATNIIGFSTNGTEAMRIDSGGRVLVDNTGATLGSASIQVGNPDIASSSGAGGVVIGTNGNIQQATNTSSGSYLNDSSSSAGTHNYLIFRFQGSNIGDIDTADNNVVRYNTFTGGHWTQFEDGTQPDVAVGTVLSTIDDMLQWTEYEYTHPTDGYTDKITGAGHNTIGETKTIYIDEDGATAEGTALSHDTAKRIAKCKVSDVEGDKCVYGVFAGHYKDGDSSVESLGLGVIRIGSGVTVQRGDLLESAGDGTARPQTGDTADLFKAGTIAKVTSTTVVETYDDGSYTVPCTLHCG